MALAPFPGSCPLGSDFVRCLPESNVDQREEGAAKEGAGTGEAGSQPGPAARPGDGHLIKEDQ